jgi:5-methylthioribose kinase
MLELTPDNTLAYLHAKGWIDDGPAQVEMLTGGVSNQVLRVTIGSHCFVLKQSRPQLRTRDAWFSDLERIYREQEVMQALLPHLPPLTVPQILFTDRENFVYAMSHAPTPFRVWKENLLAGEAEEKIALQVGLVLGKMHEGAARNPQVFQAFADAHVFDQLRIDPFYRRIQQRRPEVAEQVGRLIEQMLTRRESLCHGDYTPKNMLVHAQGFTLVDYETAYFGDPTMDLGLCLCHVMLKAVRQPAWRDRYFALTRAFWIGYEREVHFQSLKDLQERGIAHFAACILTRVDGTSPVEYLPEESKREAVRRLGRILLLERVNRWDQVLVLFETELRCLNPGENRG